MAHKKPQARILTQLQKAFAFHQQGKLDEAWMLYEQILATDPKMPDALHLSGSIANQRGNYDEAVRRIAGALATVGSNAMYLVSYGNALAGLNRHTEAETAFRRALAADPTSSAAHNNLGNLLFCLGRYEEAIVEFDQTLVHQPRHLNALLTLGQLLIERNAPGPGLALLRRAREAAPENEKVLMALAHACYRADQHEAAMEVIDAARQIRPHSAASYVGAGIVAAGMQRYGESIVSFRRALELQPGNILAVGGLAAALCRLGEVVEAVEAIRHHVRNSPAAPSLHSDLLFLLCYLPDIPAEELAAAHRTWNARFALPIASSSDFENRRRAPDRLLRIGYVSADFRTHSVAFFIEPIFEHHDRHRFEIVAYHSSCYFDETTQRLKSLANVWRDVSRMSDRELAELIRADEIDILVDLSGHTAENRLLVFARRPAPVQISYLGYPGTTGLSAIQYRISDAVADPPGVADDLSSEALLRLPGGFHCYRPAAGSGSHFRPPSEAQGRITFGSFNVIGKISTPVIAAWAAILKALPHARLALKSRGFADSLARQRIVEAFAHEGIAPDRIDCDSHQDSHAEHMARYRELDIALDTFPYNGTTTTCDALWMGVPVITVRGDRHAARVGASLLGACQLEELVAADVAGYVDCALRLARDAPRLARLHGELRQRLRASPLMDGPAFAHKLEHAYREVWRDWCAGQGEQIAPTGRF